MPAIPLQGGHAARVHLLAAARARVLWPSTISVAMPPQHLNIPHQLSVQHEEGILPGSPALGASKRSA